MLKKGYKLRWKLIKEIAKDLRYLLARDYHKESAINFLANRWQLSDLEREVLRRGVFTPYEARVRLLKKKEESYIRGRALYVDGFNVLTTIRSAIAGLPVFLADDGFLRDLGKLTPKFKADEISEKALLLLIKKLKKLNLEKIIIYLDKPLSKSGELAARLRQLFEEEAISGEVFLVPSADKALLGMPLLATSDAALLDRCEAAFDLAASVLQEVGYEGPELTGYHFSQLENGEIKRDNDPANYSP
ncbi:DUF434 domain-containing protein [Thermodesulfatator autotrophicus]|uniref:DUF434 domain-containing protein n=1 Tax=Thermodesulfatator autotrophicus TaxID=1795632 RepID=A0A177EA58_9BACT|nr:DUF434 domain-containing protein [Thermodesulfatator autotrophicus]OAG28310.1 hypothetical protein TH606_02290 [Thermodesulfatator autotrophicus]